MKTYPIFEQWYKTSNWILDKCDKMPKHTRFTITGRIANITLETLDLISFAIYSQERDAYLQQINLNLERLRIFFRLCTDRHYISQQQNLFVQEEINRTGKMCGGWKKKSTKP